MPLFDNGKRAPRTDGGVNALTVDQDGLTVVVEPSQEAIQDHAWPILIGVASKKYDSGEVIPASDPPRVSVSSEDCV